MCPTFRLEYGALRRRRQTRSERGGGRSATVPGPGPRWKRGTGGAAAGNPPERRWAVMGGVMRCHHCHRRRQAPDYRPRVCWPGHGCAGSGRGHRVGRPDRIQQHTAQGTKGCAEGGEPKRCRKYVANHWPVGRGSPQLGEAPTEQVSFLGFVPCRSLSGEGGGRMRGCRWRWHPPVRPGAVLKQLEPSFKSRETSGELDSLS